MLLIERYTISGKERFVKHLFRWPTPPPLQKTTSLYYCVWCVNRYAITCATDHRHHPPSWMCCVAVVAHRLLTEWCSKAPRSILMGRIPDEEAARWV